MILLNLLEGWIIPAELFQIFKDDAVKVLNSICLQTWKTQQWLGLEWSVFILISKKVNVKEHSNYCTIALISHISKVMLKISKSGFNSIWTENFQVFKLDLEKAEEPEIKLPTSIGSSKKQENSRKTSASLTTLKSLWLCGSQQTVENSSRYGNISPPYLPPEKSVCRLRSNS